MGVKPGFTTVKPIRDCLQTECWAEKQSMPIVFTQLAAEV